MTHYREDVVPLYGSGRRARRSGRRRLRVWEWAILLAVALSAGFAVVHQGDGGPAFPMLAASRVAAFPGGGAAPASSLAIITRLDGPAGVTGGDTLKVAGDRVRLFGVDAPESAQTCTRADGQSWPCGAEATAELRRLVAGGPVSCIIENRDGHGWAVSTCAVGGVDIGAAMVRAGLALAYRHYSTRYVDDEAAARRYRVGLWDGTFMAPWDWRRARKG